MKEKENVNDRIAIIFEVYMSILLVKK